MAFPVKKAAAPAPKRKATPPAAPPLTAPLQVGVLLRGTDLTLFQRYQDLIGIDANAAVARQQMVIFFRRRREKKVAVTDADVLAIEDMPETGDELQMSILLQKDVAKDFRKFADEINTRRGSLRKDPASNASVARLIIRKISSSAATAEHRA